MTQYTPPWLDKVRFIVRYYLSGCEATWSLYAEKAVPQSKEIVMTLSALSVKDVVKEFFRPKGLRSKRHGRKGRKSRGRVGGIPDPNEMWGKRLVENTDFNRRKYGMPTRLFYVVTDLVDRVVWTVCLLEMSTDLIYESLLGVLESKKEGCDNIGRAHRQGGHHIQGGAGPIWEPYFTGALLYSVKAVFSEPWFVFLPEGTWSVTLGASMRSPTHPVDVRFRFKDTSGPGVVLAMTEYLTLDTEEWQDLILNVVVEGPMNLSIESNEVGGFFSTGYSDCAVLEIF